MLRVAAQLLPKGEAIGVQLWKARNQSGNAPEVTLGNAKREGGADREEVRTADTTALPFADASFALVLFSLAIHIVRDAAGRTQALDEAARVLKPGARSRLLSADIGSIGA